jgi:RNA recognition motif-containing protein
MNIYVGNIGAGVTEEDIQKAFAEFGEVSLVNLLKDRYTNEPRGFGFVEMPAKAEAIEAIKQMDGKEMGGKRLIVNEARPKTERRGGGGGGGSRGRGGNSGGGSRGRGGRGGRW